MNVPTHGRRDALVERARTLAGGDPALRGAVEYLFAAPSETVVRDFAIRWRGRTPAAEEILCLFAADAEAPSAARLAALQILGGCRERSVVTRIIPLLGDADQAVRDRAGWTVGAFGDVSLLPEIAPMLESHDWGVRRAAVLALNLLRAGACREP